MCAKPELTDSETSQLQTAASSFKDWDTLIEKAQNHRLTPLLFKHINGLPDQAVPPETVNRIKRLFTLNTSRNALLTDKLLDIADVFKTLNIPVFFVKGPLLAFEAYGNENLRQYDDLDMLVPPGDLMGAVEMLTARGYSPLLTLTAAEKKAYLVSCRDWVLMDRETGILIDIAPCMGPRYFRVKTHESLFSNTRTVQMAGVNLPTISPENTLLFLLTHSCYHSWSRLSWLSDIIAFAEHGPPIDWHRFLANSASVRCTRMALSGLCLAERLLDTRLPQPVHEEIRRDPRARELAKHVEDRIRKGRRPVRNETERWRLNIMVREHLPDGIISLLRYLFAPTTGDWKFLPLPKKLFPLYYVVRPVRIVYQAMKRAIRRQFFSLSKYFRA